MSLSLAESWSGEAAVSLKVQFHSFLYSEIVREQRRRILILGMLCEDGDLL